MSGSGHSKTSESKANKGEKTIVGQIIRQPQESSSIQDQIVAQAEKEKTIRAQTKPYTILLAVICTFTTTLVFWGLFQDTYVMEIKSQSSEITDQEKTIENLNHRVSRLNNELNNTKATLQSLHSKNEKTIEVLKAVNKNIQAIHGDLRTVESMYNNLPSTRTEDSDKNVRSTIVQTRKTLVLVDKKIQELFRLHSTN